jgi:transposase InsO family protein
MYSRSIIESTVQPETKSENPFMVQGNSEPALTLIPSKDNLELDVLNKYIKEDEKVSRKQTILRMWKQSGMSATAFSKHLKDFHGVKASKDSLLRWDAKGHSKRALRRKSWTRKDARVADEESIRLQNQLDYVLGHRTLVGTGFREAWKELCKVSEPSGWGAPMSEHSIRHRWKAMDDWEKKHYTDERAAHYSKFALIARVMGLLPNQIWQMDELQFKIPNHLKKMIDIYAVAVVDRVTEVVRAMLFSLSPINKTTFMAAMKEALLPNPGLGIFAAAKPDAITVDNAKFHEPDLNAKTEFDFRLACAALEIQAHYNDKHTPQQNCMVENWNGKFKGTFVPKALFFLSDLAPARNGADDKALLRHVLAMSQEFIRDWNTQPDRKPTSRLETYLAKAKSESFAVSHAEIDTAVRVTVVRTVCKYGIILGNDEYFVADEIVKFAGRKLRIRIRPEGVGQDVDAYFGDDFVGTLKRPSALSGLSERLVKAYGQHTERFKARQEAQMVRFRDAQRMQALRDLPPDHPVRDVINHTAIIEAQRKLKADRQAAKLAWKAAAAVTPTNPPAPPADPKPATATSSTADDQDQAIDAEVL